jgi:DeoR family transcriptional regulator of aga operon
MTARDRWSFILSALADGTQVDVEEIASALGVSGATIRRDLDRLAQQQLLTRTRGGAVSNSTAYDLPLRYNAERNVSQKVAIAEAASARIPLGAVVAITGGTTTTEVARALATRADLHAPSTGTAMTIVTNAINIANELTVRSHISLVVLGGIVRPQSYELTGRLASRALEEMSIDWAILGGNALDLQTGLTCHNEGEATIASDIARRAAKRMVVLDSTKLNRKSFARICSMSDIDLLITDSSADPAFVAEVEEEGLEVVVAK